MRISPPAGSLAIILFAVQWISLLASPPSADYLAVAVTVVLLRLVPKSRLFIVALLQSSLLLVAPGTGLRSFGVAIAGLGGARLERISYRWSLLVLAGVFLLLARVQGYPLPLMFLGLFGGAAVVYGVSRVPEIRPLLNRYLAALLLVMPVYTLAYIRFGSGFSIRPVVAIPLDMVQVVTAAVLICTMERWWDNGPQNPEADRPQPEDGTVGSGGSPSDQSH